MDKILDDIKQALDNGHISGGERKAIKANLVELATSPRELAVLRSKVFDHFKEMNKSKSDLEKIEALETLIKLLIPNENSIRQTELNEAYFSPGSDCKHAIIHHLRSSRQMVDICVFTISDNDISNEIIRAHDKKVKLRILTDNDKLEDRGSDVNRFVRAGIEVKTDSTDDHMHHKFAIFDGNILVNGSFNWTRSASERNQENIVVTNNKYLLEKFSAYFEKVWRTMSHHY